MKQKDKQLLLKDLCSRLPYGVIIDSKEYNEANYRKHYLQKLFIINAGREEIYCVDVDDYPDPKRHRYKLESCKPYLRPMSSMTEEEKKELLCTIVGKNAVKYFQVLSDGSIDNTDAEYQDLQNFTMHWIIFDTLNTTSYIDWLNANHFDYHNLIERGLAVSAPEGMYNF